METEFATPSNLKVLRHELYDRFNVRQHQPVRLVLDKDSARVFAGDKLVYEKTYSSEHGEPVNQMIDDVLDTISGDIFFDGLKEAISKNVVCFVYDEHAPAGMVELA